MKLKKYSEHKPDDGRLIILTAWGDNGYARHNLLTTGVYDAKNRIAAYGGSGFWNMDDETLWDYATEEK